MTREQWLAERKTGIGASDAAAVLGLSPWKSALQLYAEKIGVMEEPAETEAMRWGLLLEEPIAVRFAEETGRTVVNPGPFVLQRNPAVPFAHATLDRTWHKNGDHGVLEIKTTGIHKAEEWDDEPPIHYQIQVQHQLLVTGMDLASIAVLIGGQQFRWADVVRNADFLLLLMDREAEFWRRVELRDPPPADASDSTAAALKALYPQDSGETVALPGALLMAAEELAEAKRHIKEWREREQAAENAIKAAMGSSSYGVLPDGTKFSYKTSARTGYVVEPTTVRALRRLK